MDAVGAPSMDSVDVGRPDSAAATPAPSAAATPAATAEKRAKAPPRRVSLWNTVYRRRICGNSAPMECNLVRYLAKHPECEVYCGQDAGRPGSGADSGALRRVGETVANAPPTASSAARPRRVALWHKLQKRKVVGNAAPLEKNVASYLAKHPHFEVYREAYREKDIQRAVEKVMTAIVSSVAALNRDSACGRGYDRKRKPHKQISGGKRPKGGGARPPRRRVSGARPRPRQGRGAAGLTFLLKIASGSPDASGLRQRDREAPGPGSGLLDLLVQATHGAPRAIEQPAQTATAPQRAASLEALELLAASPESPPFSPMSQPAEAMGSMEELKLAPSLCGGVARHATSFSC